LLHSKLPDKEDHEKQRFLLAA
jgi:hypothetical protein